MKGSFLRNSQYRKAKNFFHSRKNVAIVKLHLREREEEMSKVLIGSMFPFRLERHITKTPSVF